MTKSSEKYTGQKNLSLTCICPIDLIQKQSDLFYCNSLLDLNFHIKFSVNEKAIPLLFMRRIQILFIDFLLRPINLSKGPVSFPIISIGKMSRKRVLQEISIPAKRYKRFSSETLGNYTQEAAVKLNLNYEF